MLRALKQEAGGLKREVAGIRAERAAAMAQVEELLVDNEELRSGMRAQKESRNRQFGAWNEEGQRRAKAAKRAEFKRVLDAKTGMCKQFEWGSAIGKGKAGGWAALLTGNVNRGDDGLLDAAFGFW